MRRGAPLVGLAATVLLCAIVWTAWVCDDAFITVRTVDNLLAGHGLRWNPGERVQSYTHPLWALMLVPLHAITGDGWATLIALSLATSVATIVALVGLHHERPPWLAIALVALASSKAFVEYATSGLENPLTHLLLVVALAAWLAEPGTRGRLAVLGACVGLALVNRLDTLLLFAPLAAHAVVQEGRARPRRVVLALTLALVPIACWELFSVVYYGFPFPNTAYAKLGSGLPRETLLVQGLLYGTSLLAWDAPSVLLLVGGLGAASILEPRRWAVPAGAVGLYLAYVVWIGGDFMVGRFFSAPVLVAAVALAHLRVPLPHPHLVAPAVLVGLTLAGPTAPLRTGPAFGGDYLRDGAAGEQHFDTFAGIADERAFYFPGSSLVGRPWRDEAIVHRFATDGRAAAAAGEPVVVYDCIGFFGYYAGPGVHVVDRYGLADPILARLPMAPADTWRPGHYLREVPDGYVESLQTGENRLTDPFAASVWDDVRPRIAGPLLEPSRMRMVLGVPTR